MGWIRKWLGTSRGMLTVEAAIVVPLLFLIGLGLAQYLGHMRDVEVTRQAFHNTCLQLSLQDTAALNTPAGTSLAMAANLTAMDTKVDIQYLYVRENTQGDFVAKLYWVREAPVLGYVVTTFEKTGRSIYRGNDGPRTDGLVEDPVVYVTATGAKYHESSCFHLRKSRHETTQSVAEAQGYEACAHCILGVPLFESKT